MLNGVMPSPTTSDNGSDKTEDRLDRSLSGVGACDYASESGAVIAGQDFVPLSVPFLNGRESEYLRECIDSNWVATGSFIDRFEAAVETQLGAANAVATSSGTAALHLALAVCDIGPDEEVLVSTLTFIASANAVRYVGAHPIFVDAEPEFGQFSVEKATAFLEDECEPRNGVLRNRRTGRRVKALMPVHILGHPADIDPVIDLARRFDLRVVEDATEALGARYRGRAVGTHGDVACLSFNGNKIITAGGGGMLVTANEDWADRASYLATQAKDDPVQYVHQEVGFNYRLTNLQAAVGLAQMEQLGDILMRKRAIAERYADALRSVPGLDPIGEAEWAFSNFWLNTVRVDTSKYPLDPAALRAHLASSGIESRPLWQPLHMSPAHAGAQSTDCTTAEELQSTSLCLPSSAGLSNSDQDRVVDTVVSTE